MTWLLKEIWKAVGFVCMALWLFVIATAVAILILLATAAVVLFFWLVAPVLAAREAIYGVPTSVKMPSITIGDTRVH